MTSHKSIGLLTWLASPNYGTNLQAFALFSALKKLGYPTTFICPFAVPSLKSLPRRMARHLLKFLHPRRHQPPAPATKKSLRVARFIDEEIARTRIRSRADYHRLLRTTDVFCVGSDQLWNSYYTKDTFMLLPWAKGVKRISYATSIGTDDIAPDMRATYRRELRKFAHLSLREETGCRAIAALTSRTDVRRVLDPTLLLTPDDWRAVAQNAEADLPLPSPYILCYLIGANAAYHAQLQDVQQRIGIPRIIHLPAAEASDFTIPEAIRCEDAGVREFLRLLDGAALVVTDSFHATALSINLRRPFIEFLRFPETAAANQNSRIHDLLSVFHLQNRLYAPDSAAWAEPLDYSPAASLLASARADSLAYLVNAIEA